MSSCALVRLLCDRDRGVEIPGGVEDALRVERRPDDDAHALDVGRGVKRQLTAIADVELEIRCAHDVGQQGDAFACAPLRVGGRECDSELTVGLRREALLEQGKTEFGQSLRSIAQRCPGGICLRIQAARRAPCLHQLRQPAEERGRVEAGVPLVDGRRRFARDC